MNNWKCDICNEPCLECDLDIGPDYCLSCSNLYDGVINYLLEDGKCKLKCE
jgi:hypothetical protein